MIICQKQADLTYQPAYTAGVRSLSEEFTPSIEKSKSQAERGGVIDNQIYPVETPEDWNE